MNELFDISKADDYGYLFTGLNLKKKLFSLLTELEFFLGGIILLIGIFLPIELYFF